MRYYISLSFGVPQPVSKPGANIGIFRPANQFVLEGHDIDYRITHFVDFIDQECFVDFIIRHGYCLIVVISDIDCPIIILQGKSKEI